MLTRLNGDHFAIYTSTELCRTPESNTTFYYASILKKEKLI